MIALVTGLIMTYRIIGSHFNSYPREHNSTEIFWSIVPAFVLIMIAVPSIDKLYNLEEQSGRALVVKANGHQWYWSYQFIDVLDMSTDSFVDDSIHRLVMADKHLIVPGKTNIQVLTSSSDVIHSWTVPSLGVKADAVPGRINNMTFSASRPGVFVGQCSEICGANHRFIPITLSVVPPRAYVTMLSS